MTKSTITREQLLEIIETDHVQCGEASYLASMALAAMDSEPVAWTWHYREQWHVTNDERRAEFVAKDGDVAVLPLYRHAQPAKTVHPVMFIDGDISSEDADKLAKVIRELHEKDERPLAKMARIIRENPRPINECDMPKAQPVPVVSEVSTLVSELPAPVVPGKWIPVSERMPQNDVSVLTFDGMYKRVHHAMYGHWQCWEPEKITHWMPLPAAPQEPKP